MIALRSLFLVFGLASLTQAGPVRVLYLDATGAEHDEALGVTTKNPPEELPEFTDGTTAECEVVFLLPEEDEGEGVIGVGPAATAPAGRVFVEAG